MMENKRHRASFCCPHCGADVRAGASACAECGSDDTTGWSDGAADWGSGATNGYGGDDDFDYDEFVEREFGGPKKRVFGLPAWLLVLALIAIVVVALGVC